MRRVSTSFLIAASFAWACAPGSEGTRDDAALHASAGAGADGAGGGEAAPTCGALAEAIPDASCNACATSSCCDALTACDDGTPCGAIAACVSTCADDGCIASCHAADPEGAAALDAAATCLESSCADACAAPTAGVCGTELTTQDETCDACVGGSCCAPLTACTSDPTCAACILGDSTATGCETDPFLADVASCFTTACSGVCDG